MSEDPVRVLPTEVELAIERFQPCLAGRRTYERPDRAHPCEFFAEQGSFHSFDLRAPGPPGTPGVLQPVHYAGRRRVTPEMLSGCRKAPIMAVGINPNLPVFWRGKHNSVLPVFDDVLQYAHHYRYRAIGKLQIPQAAYDELRAGRPDDPASGEPLAAEGAELPVELADQRMYTAYQGLLDGLAAEMGWAGAKLAVGEDLSYGNMVACGSPRSITRPDPAMPSLPVMTTAQRQGIVDECFFERRYFLRQLFQSLPRVLLVFGAATRDAFARAMAGHFTEGAPQPGEDLEVLLARRIVLRYGRGPDGAELTARVLFVPHASGNAGAFEAVRAKVVAALAEEATAGRLELDPGSGHLRRPRGGCTFCDNALYRIGPCDYREQLVPLAGPLEESDGDGGGAELRPELRERRAQESLLDRFLAAAAAAARIEESGEEEAAGGGGLPDRCVLRGRVVTMDASFTVIPQGAIYVHGDRIEAVREAGAPAPEGYGDAPRLDTGGTIYPGLVDLHNHVAYNVLPPWPVPKRFDDRSQWRRAKSYAERVGLMGRLRTGNPARAVARYVEVKALLGGATTLQGMRSIFKEASSALRGLVRNVEIGGEGMPRAGSSVTDLDPRKPEQLERFRAAAASTTSAYCYHLSEGINDASRQFWRDVVEHELLGPGLVGIHCLAVPPAGLEAIGRAGATVVWSPTSNLMLYGQTLPVRALLDSGARWVLGCDWSPTGGKNLLFELKSARAAAAEQGVQLRARDLVAAVTSRAARAVCWHEAIGAIAPGLLADLVVIEGDAADPYEQLVAATEADVRLVMIGGTPRAGAAALFDAARVPAKGREEVELGARTQQLWLREPGTPLDGFGIGRAAKLLRERMTAAEVSEEESAEDFDPQAAAFALDLDDEMAPLAQPGGQDEAAVEPIPQPPDALAVVGDDALWEALEAIDHFSSSVEALRDYYR